MQINLWYYGENIKTSQALNRNTMFDANLFDNLDITTKSKYSALKGYGDALRDIITLKEFEDGEFRIIIDEMKETVKTFKKESNHDFKKITHLRLVK